MASKCTNVLLFSCVVLSLVSWVCGQLPGSEEFPVVKSREPKRWENLKRFVSPPNYKGWKSSPDGRARYKQRRAKGKLFTYWACADLNKNDIRKGSPTNAETLRFAKSIGKRSDVANHILPTITGKRNWNIIPVTKKLQDGALGYVGRQAFIQLRAGRSIRYCARMRYAKSSDTRPTRIVAMLFIKSQKKEEGPFDRIFWEMKN